MPNAADQPTVHVPGHICRDPDAAMQREWLVTNGLGGFASGTVAGCLTRRYHGLLLAALQPPLGRTLLLAKLDETLRVGDNDFALYTNNWTGGVEHPPGCGLLRRFDLVLGVPTWTFEFAGCRLIKRIWMEPRQNTTYVQYELKDAPCAFTLTCKALVNYRDYHSLTRAADWCMQVDPAADGLTVRAFDGAVPLRLRCGSAVWETAHEWHRDFTLPAERERGFDFQENHLCCGQCVITLEPGKRVGIVASTLPDADLDTDAALQRRHAEANDRLNQWRRANRRAADAAPLPVRQLVLAADQFVVTRSKSVSNSCPSSADARRSPSKQPPGRTIIAGYPWFTDWGRDTMIALPGLALVTGRRDVARDVLLTFARHVDRGMIPNRFPDEGATPDYNAADATLWFVWAVAQYVRTTRDTKILDELYQPLTEIIHHYRTGTRYDIHVDDDGLLHAGESGVQLTWMDAKIGPHVVTPRTGKPVELNALWFDALSSVASFAEILEKPSDELVELAKQTREGFARFWNQPADCCFDVLDGPSGDDPAVRPNQIFAVSLPASRTGNHLPTPKGLPQDLLTAQQSESVVRTCRQQLLTWFGLRSLSPDDGAYHGTYHGDYRARDEAYHQGTSWGWLLGPFVTAHYHVYNDAVAARAFLEPLLGQLFSHGLGSLSEIFDGDSPHAPNGCIAQAWTVAEALRAWQTITAH